MARAVLREIVFGLATTGLLVGCVDGGGKAGTGGGTGGGAGSILAPAAKTASGQEVEAPDVFQTTDSALWDGRPSLGGIWVASPNVTNPERVVMFNPANGKTITGALFRRERENPGPTLQLSSDAADALGILAGAPTEISVTALRKEAVAEAPAAIDPAAPAADGTATDSATKDTAAAPAKDADAAAIASAALAAVDGGKSGKTAPAAKDADPAAAAAAGTAAAGTAAVAATAADGAAGVVDATPKKKTWKERRAEAKAAREAKKQAAAEAKAAAAAAAAGTVVAAEGEAPVATPDAAAAAIAPIESAPLDARSPEALAPVETKKSKRKAAEEAAAAKAAADTAADTSAAATAAAPAPTEAPVATGPARPIQVASFSKEDNANRAAQALAKIGITATPQKSDKGGKAVWGVVVMGDAAMLTKIKDAGFADAYFLK
jgi:rare lipoprotein A